MIDYFQERPFLAAFIGAVVVIAGMVIYAQRSEKAEESRDEASGVSDETERMRAIRTSEYSDPVSTLRIVRAALSAPESDAEAAYAQEKLPEVLNLCFHHYLKENEFDLARGILDDLKREAPDSFQAVNTDRDWGRSLRSRWSDANRDSDVELGDSLFDQIITGNYIDHDTRFLEDYQRMVLAEWTRERGRGNEDIAQLQLIRAAKILVSATPNNPMVDVLYKADWRGHKQFALAESLFSSGEIAAAIPLYQSAARKLNSGRESAYGGPVELDYDARERIAARIGERLVDALVQIGDGMRLGLKPVITTLTAKEIYRDAAHNTRDERVRVVPLRRQLGVEIDAFFAASDPMNGYAIQQMPDEGYLSRKDIDLIYKLSQEAQRNAGQIFNRTALEVWRALLKDPAFNPWPLVDADVVYDIENQVPSSERENERRELLGKKAQDKAYVIPLSELAPVRERINQVEGRFGLLTFSSNSERAMAMLRRALRGTQTGRLRAEIAEALKKLIRKSHSEGEFEALYELAGFYVSEVGVSGKGDPFRDEFRASLEGAVENFRDRSTMKYIFLLTVLADSYPDELVGKQARKEALTLGFEAVSGIEMQADLSGDDTASGLEDWSVVIIDNSTNYHLLTFFKGPESFFVNCYPYRRGSIVLQDGDYEIAVITPSGAITPYHGQTTLTSEAMKSVYTIQQADDEDSQGMIGNSAMGKYTVLRKPNTLRDLKIDTRTGEVLGDRMTSAAVSNSQ